MGYSDRQGTCECHLQAILSSFHIPIAHPVVHALKSLCLLGRLWQLPVILTRFSDENTIQLLEEKKNQKWRTSFTKFLNDQKSFLSSLFFSFLLPLLFGGKWNKWSLLISQACSQRDMRRWCCWWSETSGVTLGQVEGQNDWILGSHWPTSLAKSVTSRFRGAFLEIKN